MKRRTPVWELILAVFFLGLILGGAVYVVHDNSSRSAQRAKEASEVSARKQAEEAEEQASAEIRNRWNVERRDELRARRDARQLDASLGEPLGPSDQKKRSPQAVLSDGMTDPKE